MQNQCKNFNCKNKIIIIVSDKLIAQIINNGINSS